MKLRIKYLLICVLIGAINFSSCKKYLNEKPLKSAVVPKTIEDLEALLNARWIIASSPAVNEIVSDDYYIDIEDWQYLMGRSSIAPTYYDECLNYYWDSNAVHKSWIDTYKNPIYYSNVVLDLIPVIKTSDQVRLNKVKGSALFYRAFAFDRLAQVYCKPYSSTSKEDLGLVLRMTSDINQPAKRATVQETYDLIIKDLKEAVDLLPNNSEFPTHPTKAAAYGSLARVYLSMRDYLNAGHYANLCLQVNSSLMDYNAIDPFGEPVFKEYNEEVIFYNRPIPPGILSASIAKINPDLYNSYEDKDLRKSLFFRENPDVNLETFRFKGAYHGRFIPAGNAVFDGITTAEMYLILAESFARAGDKESALEKLNVLMINRWTNDGSWTPIEAINAIEAKDKILEERRKELVFRGLRWSDLRRLNEEGANITLTRILDGVTYALPPGDLRWTLLVPEDVIERSSIKQNPR